MTYLRAYLLMRKIIPITNGTHLFSHAFCPSSFVHFTNVCRAPARGQQLSWEEDTGSAFRELLFQPRRKAENQKQMNEIIASYDQCCERSKQEAKLENNSQKLFQEKKKIVPGKDRNHHHSPDFLQEVIIPILQMREMWLRGVNHMINVADFFSLCSFSSDAQFPSQTLGT